MGTRVMQHALHASADLQLANLVMQLQYDHNSAKALHGSVGAITLRSNMFYRFAGSSEYTVVSGDSLAAIAAAHGLSLSQLLAANPQITNPDLIQAGQILTIPAAGLASSLQTPGSFLCCLEDG